MTTKTICDLWEELSDIPCDDSGNTEESFLGFEAGTNREEIWHWFDQYIPVHRLLYELDDVKAECEAEIVKPKQKRSTFGVVVCRYGYVEVEADSTDAAMTLVDKTVKTDEVSWNDDWSCVDAQLVDEL